VVEARAAVREQRHCNFPAQHRIESGDGRDLRLDVLAHSVRRDRQREPEQYAEAHRKDGSDGKSKALDADGHGTGFPACGDETLPTIASKGSIRQDVTIASASAQENTHAQTADR